MDTGFRKRSCSTNKLEREDDSKIKVITLEQRDGRREHPLSNLYFANFRPNLRNIAHFFARYPTTARDHCNQLLPLKPSRAGDSRNEPVIDPGVIAWEAK